MKTKINVLLTSVGRRSYLVHYFKQALAGHGKVICANVYADTPAMLAADHACVVPQSNNPEYLPLIIELCRKFEIDVLCSCHDLDTYVLSQYKNSIAEVGVIPILPSAEWGRITLDKYECSKRLEAAGIAVPWYTVCLEEALEALNDGRLEFPVIVKSRMGFGSRGLAYCKSQAMLVDVFERVASTTFQFAAGDFVLSEPRGSVLIQQGVSGHEFCIGVVNDLEGDYVCHFMAQVHAMRAGESDSATTVDPTRANVLATALSKLTQHIGWWGVDVMDDQGNLRVIDINPRFTGDYPFSHLAGANIPAALIEWVRGGVPKTKWLTAEIGISGYKDLVPKRQ